MKTDLQILSLEPTAIKGAIGHAENFVKAAGRKIRQAQMAHLQRLPIAKSRTGHRGVFLP